MTTATRGAEAAHAATSAARGARARQPRKRGSSLAAEGEPWVWLTGGALVICIAMIVGLLALVIRQGAGTFWPVPAVEVKTASGTFLGEVTHDEEFRPSPGTVTSGSAADSRAASTAAAGAPQTRRQFRVGNFEITGEHYHWVPQYEVQAEFEPEWALVIERMTWGRFYGKLEGFTVDGKPAAATPDEAWRLFNEHHAPSRARAETASRLGSDELGVVNHELEMERLSLRRFELQHGRGSPEFAARERAVADAQARLTAKGETIQAKIRAIRAENERFKLVLETATGPDVSLTVADVVRAYPANRLSFSEKLRIYGARWWEFLTAEPREANSEGGVFPAIFGTVVMTLLMSLAVVPLGVLAALYLREYAKAGPIVSAVRIAVNNLAGVPSIVFGVFGLGFFCYTLGGGVDRIFFAEKLPSPTFGTGGVLWSALTLALLTLPVVVVATEEALAAVPRSMREGSYACGASKWQTIRRIVLPRAMPGIMTGFVLAMARGAGEVAPLMLVGAAKLAPDLPIDGTAPFIHLQRGFMHLGFHIFDLGFQSQNSEAAKPMVYTTTLLLIAIIVTLNVAAVAVRTRLRRRFLTGHF